MQCPPCQSQEGRIVSLLLLVGGITREVLNPQSYHHKRFLQLRSPSFSSDSLQLSPQRVFLTHSKSYILSWNGKSTYSGARKFCENWAALIQKVHPRLSLCLIIKQEDSNLQVPTSQRYLRTHKLFSVAPSHQTPHTSHASLSSANPTARTITKNARTMPKFSVTSQQVRCWDRGGAGGA